MLWSHGLNIDSSAYTVNHINSRKQILWEILQKSEQMMTS